MEDTTNVVGKKGKMEMENIQMRSRFSGEVSIATVPHCSAVLKC